MRSVNCIFNPNGTVKAQNVTPQEWVRSIPVASIIGERIDGNLVSEGIREFKHGFSSHLMIYLGGGTGRVGSSEGGLLPFSPSGFIPRTIYSHFKVKRKRMRVYANSKMTVYEAEIFKERAYALMDIQQGYGIKAIFGKALLSVCAALRIKPPVLHDDDLRPVCNVAIMKIFMAQLPPSLRIVLPDVTEESAGPGDTDAYMLTPQAREAGWFVLGEWRNLAS